MNKQTSKAELAEGVGQDERFLSADRLFGLTRPTDAAAPGGTASGTQTLTLDGKAVEVTVGLRTADVPPPPPVTPTLTSFMVTPTTVKPGGTLTLEATLSANATSPQNVVLTTPFGSRLITIAAGTGRGQATVTVPVGQANGALTFQATYAGKTLQQSVTVQADTQPPPPPPPGVINVVEKGAKGDGVFDNTALLRKLVEDNRTKPTTLFFPAGVYKVSDSIACWWGNLTLLGEDPTKSIIDHGGKRGVDLGPRADMPPLPGYAIKNLGFRGLQGLYMRTGNSDPSIQIGAGQGVVLENLIFNGSGQPINIIGQSYGTQITNCRANGWGVTACFLNGGETVRDCTFIQDDPDLYGERSSHGFYIHSGSKSVNIINCRVENARKFSAQVYGEELNTTTEDVTFKGSTFSKSSEGITVQMGGQGKARPKRITFEDCVFEDIYRYTGLWIMQGDDIVVRRCTFRNVKGGALVLGRWNSYYSPDWSTIVNLVAEDCIFDNCPLPIYVEDTQARGKLINCKIVRPKFINGSPNKMTLNPTTITGITMTL